MKSRERRTKKSHNSCNHTLPDLYSWQNSTFERRAKALVFARSAWQKIRVMLKAVGALSLLNSCRSPFEHLLSQAAAQLIP